MHLRSSLVALFLINFSSANHIVTQIESHETFNQYIRTFPYVIAYCYSSAKYNDGEKKDINTNLQHIIDIIISSNEDIRVLAINIDDKRLEELKRIYRLHGVKSMILFFYKGKIIQTYPIQAILNTRLINKMTREIYSPHTTYHQLPKKIKQESVQINRNKGRRKKHNYTTKTKKRCRYSYPRFGVSFGVSFNTWPGYWYGRGCGF